MTKLKDGQPPATPPPFWFVVSQFPRYSSGASGSDTESAATVAHAKTMGTWSTVCGIDARSWVKRWEIDFLTLDAPRCEECLVEVRSAARRPPGRRVPM